MKANGELAVKVMGLPSYLPQAERLVLTYLALRSDVDGVVSVRTSDLIQRPGPMATAWCVDKVWIREALRRLSDWGFVKTDGETIRVQVESTVQYGIL